MGVVNPTQSNPGDTIEAADVNTPVNQLAAVINGNIETVNIADGSVTRDKIANSSVNNAKIDFGGSGAGIWWEEIGRTTLSVAGDTISVTSLPARKYLKVFLIGIPTGGTIRSIFRFNNDSGNNYAHRYSSNGSADTTASAQGAGILNTSVQQLLSVELNIVNIATQEKIAEGIYSLQGTAGAANAPNRSEGLFKWANLTDLISRIDAVNDGTGDLAIGSELVVLGHN